MVKTSTGDHPDLTLVNPAPAAIDIGSTMHMAAVNPDSTDRPVRAFGTFTRDLHDLADWFRSCGVSSVAMESTGVYWIPAFEILEQHGFDVILVDARYVKNVPGRKTDPEFDRWYCFAVVAAEPGPLRATGGVTISAGHGLSTLSQADLIVVPGWRGAEVPAPEPLRAAVRDAHDRGARVMSICSGVFVLAASGLLDGRRATTHWRYTDALAATYPRIEVDPDVLFVEDGRLLTSAGSAAGLDLGLHLIRRDYGARAAAAVARRLVLPAQREGGQRQFVPHPQQRRRGGTTLFDLQDRVRASLDEPWPVERMARTAAMSRRTLARRFADDAGTTPLAWLTATRVARAAELLEGGVAPLPDVAEACGFGSSETFRREFRRATGISPFRHREQFGQMEPQK